MTTLHTTTTEEKLQAENQALRQRVAELERQLETCTRETEEAVQKSHVLLQRIVDHATLGIFVKTIDGRYIVVNQAIAAITSIAPEDILNKTDDEIFAPELARLFQAQDEYVLRTRQSLQIELDYPVEDETVALVVNRFPIYDDQGTLYALAGITTDITERKRTESMLESERRLFARGPIVVFKWTASEGWPVEYVSPNIIQFGYMPEDFTSGTIPYGKIIYPDDKKRVSEEVRSYIEGGHPYFEQDYRIICADGAIRWVYDHTIIIRNAQGDITHYYGYILDMTERKHMESALRESEARYRAVVEDQTELICRFQPDCTLTFVNEAYASYFGKTSNELIGTNFLNLIPQGERQHALNHLASLNHQNLVYSYEHRVLRTDGTIGWQQWTDRIIFDEHGHPFEIQSVGRDITERKRIEEALRNAHDQLEQRVQERTARLFEINTALQDEIAERTRIEEALRESEARYRAISEIISDYAYALRVEPDMTMTMEWVTDAFRRITGYTFEDVHSANSVTTLIHPDDHLLAMERTQRLFNNQPDVSEFRIITRSGDVCWLRDHAQPVWDSTKNRVVRIYGAAQDITERVRAEEALRESEEKFRSFFEQSWDGSTLVDSTGLVVEWNRGVERITGLKRDEVVGQPGWDVQYKLVPNERKDPTILERLKEFTLDVFKRGISSEPRESIGQIVQRPDGTRRTVHSLVFPIQTGSGILFGSIIRDVTEQIEAEEALRESEARYRTLVETSPSAVLLTDLDGTIRFCNRQAAQLFGYSRVEDLYGKNDKDLVAADQHIPDPLAYMQQFLHSGKLRNIEYTMCRQDGSQFPAEINSSVVTDEQGFSSALIIVVKDISERKQAEQSLTDAYNELKIINDDLSRSRNLLRLIFNGLDDGLLLLDTSDTVQQANNAVASLLGTVPDALIGQSWQAILQQLNNESWNTDQSDTPLFRDSSSPARVSLYHARYRGPDGATRILNIQTIERHDPDQNVEQTIVHVVDVTRPVQLQARVIENERFAANGRLAASVAHEINTPLQALQTSLEMIQLAQEPERSQFLEYAMEEMQRIGRIVHQLLDLYRPSATAIGPVQMNTLIERLLLLIGKRIRDQRVEVDLDLCADLPAMRGRADELMQILLNLMVNALDAMPTGGTIGIRTYAESHEKRPGNNSNTTSNLHANTTTPQKDAWRQQGGHISPLLLPLPLPSLSSAPQDQAQQAVVVAITDSGEGISPELQTRIFDSFVTTKAKGTGLGLAISKQIVQQHGGSITVQSKPGKGSTFTVFFPHTQHVVQRSRDTL